MSYHISPAGVTYYWIGLLHMFARCEPCMGDGDRAALLYICVKPCTWGCPGYTYSSSIRVPEVHTYARAYTRQRVRLAIRRLATNTSAVPP